MRDFDPLGANLVFLISLPRSGSTLLQRILAGHADVATLAEPWIMLHPLYALKRKGIESEYDAVLAREALDDFLAQIEGGEEAYIQGIRRFAGDLYANALTRQGGRLFLDKTPRYYRILPELRRVFPRAKFIFLLRNPLAVLASTLHTWFEDDPTRLVGTSNEHDLNEGPALLLAGMAELGEDAIVLRYEEFISNPERVVAELCARLGLDFDQVMLEYGDRPAPPGRFGDQIGVPQHARATAEQRDKWVEYLAQDACYARAMQYLEQLGEEIFSALGYDAVALQQTLESRRVRHEPDDVDMSPRLCAERLNEEGESLYAQGKLDAARASFEQARAADPDYITVYNNLMVLFWESGQVENALDCLAAALEHVPHDRDLIINGAQILAALGSIEDARALCLRYLEQDPEDAAVMALLNSPGVEDPPTAETAAPAPLQSVSSAEDVAPGSITVATSIAPKGIEKQQRAVASWQALGFRVVSLNTPEEIAELKTEFAGIEFVPVNRDGMRLAGKPYVFLDDMLEYLHDRSGSRICGIINSDIILRAGSDLTGCLWREADNALVYGSRVDVETAEDAEGRVYHRGFDFFFFDVSVVKKLPKTDFMIGVPWWDYWMPVGFQLAGVPIKRLDSRIAFHVWHSTNYSTEVLIKFGREFTVHCTSAPFLSLYEQCESAGFGNAAFSVLADAALDHIHRNTSKIRLPGVTGTEPPSGERPRVSAIVSTYKSADFIGECLDDLVAQSIADRIEIIVIDADSPENERDVVAQYQARYPHMRIRYHRTEKRIGVYTAWNMAARMAQGDYLISCSTNDRLRWDACEILARTLDERPEIALVYGNSFMTKRPHQRFDSSELCSLYLWTDYRYEDLLDRCMVGPHPMWRRQVHEKIGYFDEGYIALGDQEFWLRLGRQATLMNIPDFTGLYYVSESSLTGDGDVAQRETDAVHMLYQWRHRYQQWRELSDARASTQVEAALAADQVLPTLHVLVLVPPGDLGLAADTLDSLGTQNYPRLQVSILADRLPSDPELLMETGLNWLCYGMPDGVPALVGEIAEGVAADWLCLIDAGDQLTAGALLDAMHYACANPEWRMIYVDDDFADPYGDGFGRPRFKPDFNLALLRSQPYVGACVLIQAETLRGIGGLTALSDWRGADLALRVADRYAEKAVGHVPRVLVHYAEEHASVWSIVPGEQGYQDALRAHLQRRGLNAEVVPGQLKTTWHVRRVARERPKVSLILHGGTAAHRQLALQTLLSKTDYTNFEILVLQGRGEEDLQTASLPHAERVRIVRVADMVSVAELNAAANTANGEFLLWLDGRCLVLQSDWIDRLLGQILDKDVGVVGARLVNRNKTLIDGGVIVGLGTRGIGARVNVGLHMSSPGYLARAQCEQDLSAVAGLCMLVRKKVFDAVVGFTEDLSTGLYRDVDFCLKARSEGWRIVWTPSVTLMFLGENVEADRPPRDLARLEVENTRVLERWFDRIAGEPAYNRNLSSLRQDYQLDLHVVPNWDPVVDTLPRALGFGVGSYGSWQYRVVQPLNALNESSIANCVNIPFPTENQLILPTMVDIEHMQPDVLLMHNTLHDSHIEALERYKRYNDVFVVFGQDDLMFALPPKNPYSKTVYKDMKKRIRKCAELADRLVVTTEPLAQALSEFSDDVHVLPNYLSRSLWGDLVSQRGQGLKPRVGWAGAQQHGGDLELLIDVVTTTANEVDWVFFGMCPDVLRPYVREIHRPVSFAEYPAKLASLNLDLAVAPLERNRFNEAKSNLRILEYGVLGWPVIASDIHPYQQGPICRVPNNSAAWIRAIREQLSDRDALARAGDSLQDWVRAHWMLEEHLDEWLAMLRLGNLAKVVAPLRKINVSA